MPNVLGMPFPIFTLLLGLVIGLGFGFMTGHQWHVIWSVAPWR